MVVLMQVKPQGQEKIVAEKQGQEKGNQVQQNKGQSALIQRTIDKNGGNIF